MEDERKWSVYIHENKVNRKKYVGITSQSPKNRWNKGNGYIQNKHFYSAISKYGWNNFNHTVLYSGLTKEKAEQYEAHLIKTMETKNKNKGYNKADGGKVNFGWKHSQTFKDNMSKQFKHLWNTKEYRDKMPILKGGLNPNSKSIKSNTKTFNTVLECANHYKISFRLMSQYLNGNKRTPLHIYNEMSIQNPNMKPQLIKYIINNKKVLCNGEVFNSAKECYLKYFTDVRYETLCSWLNGGDAMPRKYYYEYNLRYESDEIDKRFPQKESVSRGHSSSSKKVICDTKMYLCVKDLADDLSVPYGNLLRYLRGERKMPQKLIDLGLRYATQDEIAEYQNNTYNYNSSTDDLYK